MKVKPIFRAGFDFVTFSHIFVTRGFENSSHVLWYFMPDSLVLFS